MKTIILTTLMFCIFCIGSAQTSQKCKTDTASSYHNTNGTYHKKNQTEGTKRYPSDSTNRRNSYPNSNDGHNTYDDKDPMYKGLQDTTGIKNLNK